jgi:hypothetical protein
MFGISLKEKKFLIHSDGNEGKIEEETALAPKHGPVRDV